MKTQFMYLAFLAISIFSFQGSHAQSSLQKETFKVWGNCGMCKKKIESTAKEAGAVKASWSIKKKMLDVSFDPAVTNVNALQQAIANAGYDTRDYTANQEAYDNLHGCCQYERKSATSSIKKCCSDGKVCKDGKSCKDGKHGASASCCTEGKSCSDQAACKEKGCCSEKSCCKI